MHDWFSRWIKPSRPILGMATVLHYVWGCGLILIPGKVARTTGLWPYSQYPRTFGLLMLASATLALLALVHDGRKLNPNPWTFWAFMPQQAFLMISAGAALYFATQGHFADGTIVPGAGWFIFYDQLTKILLAIFHPFGVLRLNLPIFPGRVPRVAGDGPDG